MRIYQLNTVEYTLNFMFATFGILKIFISNRLVFALLQLDNIAAHHFQVITNFFQGHRCVIIFVSNSCILLYRKDLEFFQNDGVELIVRNSLNFEISRLVIRCGVVYPSPW